MPNEKPTARRYKVPFLLPVRDMSGGARMWQALTTWLRQGWQTWCTKRLVILPPIQPTRHKSFPNRPHQRRRQAVFAALDAATAGLPRRQLIAHVRLVTGLGCSEKLIAEWRKERQRGREKEGQGEATQGRGINQRRFFLSCLLLGVGLLTGQLSLNVDAQNITTSPTPNHSPTSTTAAGPRLLRIKLTLNAPRELCIKQGDEVRLGDLLSNRSLARQRLWLQKRTLQSARQHLQTQMQLTAASLQQLQSLGLGLPPSTFAAEQAAIKRAETEAVAVNRAVEIQRRLLSVISGLLPVENPLPFPTNQQQTTDSRQLVTEHEEVKLTQAQDKLLLAHSEIELHQAKLMTAREVRAWEEKKHQVEVIRQLLAARSQQQQSATEGARLTAQLAELDLQLAQLAEVRAPFAGTIKRIEWEEMNDEKITVVVYLVITN